MAAFLDEAEGFPEGSHDDQIDGLSGAFKVLRTEGRGEAKFHRLLDQAPADRVYNPLGLDLDDPKYTDTDRET